MANKQTLPATSPVDASVTDESAPAAPSIEAQLAEAQLKLRAAEARLVQAGVTPEQERAVRDKMLMGLTREQAMVCARRDVLYQQALTIKDPLEREQAIIRAGSAE